MITENVDFTIRNTKEIKNFLNFFKNLSTGRIDALQDQIAGYRDKFKENITAQQEDFDNSKLSESLKLDLAELDKK